MLVCDSDSEAVEAPCMHDVDSYANQHLLFDYRGVYYDAKVSRTIYHLDGSREVVEERLNDGLGSVVPNRGSIAEGSDQWSSLLQSLPQNLPDHYDVIDVLGKDCVLLCHEQVARMKAILLWC